MINSINMHVLESMDQAIFTGIRSFDHVLHLAIFS